MALESSTLTFSNLDKKADGRTYTFRMEGTHVTYANTLRRLILTGVETVAFRSDMTSTGTTTDVIVKRNDTPMTNEMLADRIGLIPIHVTDPLHWKGDNYVFHLKVSGSKDQTTFVKAGDFKVIDISKKVEQMVDGNGFDEKTDESGVILSSSDFFPTSPLTGDTCLIATLQPGSGSTQQIIELVAKATRGTGREHARFMPVSQCTYEYTLDTDEKRREEMFMKWLSVTKKIGGIDEESENYKQLLREFNTMQVKRCFKMNEKGEPNSFDFTIESVGILPVSYIVGQACEVGENMCGRYSNLDKSTPLPSDLTISPSDSRIIGYDFLFRGHDHTLGNLLQTWLVEHHIEGNASPKITYAGYSVPHPLRDEMVLRVGVEDGEEGTARHAVAEAARGCVQMFQEMRAGWKGLMGEAPIRSAVGTSTVRRKTPIIAK